MPSPRHSWFRLSLQAIVIVASIAFVAWKAAHLLSNPTFFPPDDYVEYWAAGHLNAHGQNPYDGELLLPLERAAGRDTDEPVMMWNPPWTLTLAMPIGLTPARVGQLLWLAISFVSIVFCADRLWGIYGGTSEFRWVSWLVALTFMPTLLVLQAGQIGPFILLGITGFLLASSRSNSEDFATGRPFWLRMGPLMAGACGVLMAIKPHLVYLFWFALIAWVLWIPGQSRWKVIVGGALVGLLATLIPLAANPDVLGQYWTAMRYHTPEQWKSPTIGSYLRTALGNERFGLQFVPTILGLTWLIVHAWLQRGKPWRWTEQMPMILLVSFVTASYGAWPYDVVILLPAVIHVAASVSVAGKRGRVLLALGFHLAFNSAALAMNVLGITSDKFIWMAPTLLLGYLLLRPRKHA